MDPLAQSSTWLSSVNLKSPKVFKLPIKAYADFVITDSYFMNDAKFLWDFGLNLTLLSSIVEVYFPLAYSKEVRDALDLNQVNGAQRIRFTLNIHKFTPGKLKSLLFQ